MTNFTRKSFSVGMGNSKISDENWERTFGRKEKKHTWVLEGAPGADVHICVNCSTRVTELPLPEGACTPKETSK